jgi:hypothetical protein
MSFGVAWVWVIDPVSRAGQVYSPNSGAAVDDTIFSTGMFSIDLSVPSFERQQGAQQSFDHGHRAAFRSVAASRANLTLIVMTIRAGGSQSGSARAC